MTDEMPMCDVCGAILDDDGTCPDVADHGDNIAELWIERNANVYRMVGALLAMFNAVGADNGWRAEPATDPTTGGLTNALLVTFDVLPGRFRLEVSTVD